MSFAIIFGIILAELMVVAWIDFKTEKISNKWILVNAFLSLLLHIFVSNYYPWSWETLIFPAGFIVVGFFLYLLNVMGAGDSKFLATLFLIVPLEYHLSFFEKLVISTLVTGVTLFLYRSIKNAPKLKAYVLSYYWKGVRETLKSRFSYAPVIFLAWVMLGLNIWK